jgi:hypothetical protein
VRSHLKSHLRIHVMLSRCCCRVPRRCRAPRALASGSVAPLGIQVSLESTVQVSPWRRHGCLQLVALEKTIDRLSRVARDKVTHIARVCPTARNSPCIPRRHALRALASGSVALVGSESAVSVQNWESAVSDRSWRRHGCLNLVRPESGHGAPWRPHSMTSALSWKGMIDQLFIVHPDIPYIGNFENPKLL